MDVCACASPVAGDMVDHTHNDWHCSTAEITNHYYAEGDEEHLRPSPQHIQTDRYRQTHTHTFHSPSWRSVKGRISSTFPCFLASLPSEFDSKKKDYKLQNKSPGQDSNAVKRWTDYPAEQLDWHRDQSWCNQSFKAIAHHSLTNLIIVCWAIILVTVHYDAPSVITLAFVYIGLEACVSPCTHNTMHTQSHRYTVLPAVGSTTLNHVLLHCLWLLKLSSNFLAKDANWWF